MVLHNLIMFSVIVGEGPRAIMEGNSWVSRGRGLVCGNRSEFCYPKFNCGFVFSISERRIVVVKCHLKWRSRR